MSAPLIRTEGTYAGINTAISAPSHNFHVAYYRSPKMRSVALASQPQVVLL